MAKRYENLTEEEKKEINDQLKKQKEEDALKELFGEEICPLNAEKACKYDEFEDKSELLEENEENEEKTTEKI